jgi:hypothetical protein
MPKNLYIRFSKVNYNTKFEVSCLLLHNKRTLNLNIALKINFCDKSASADQLRHFMSVALSKI